MSACEEPTQEIAVPGGIEALEAAQNPILNGTRDDGDMAVVGLFEVTEKLENGNFKGSIYCTGTIIHPYWVLTAAHCVTETDGSTVTPSSKNSRLMIYVGTDRKKSGHVYEIWGVNQIYWHPNYVDANKSGNDIALIKLKNKMTREDVTPILPHPKWLIFNDYQMPVNMKLVGFGYDHNGVTEIKNQKIMPINFYCGAGNPTNSINGCPLKNEVHVQGCHPNPYYCESKGYVDYYTKVTMSYGTLYHSIEAGGECNGDSGGPSISTIGGVQYVSGVTSWGDPVCHAFNISTSVADFYDWIINTAPEIVFQYKEICGNGIDDDGNGKIDNADPACIYCGNNIVNVGEACDGSHFSGDRTTCTAWDSNLYSGGNVSCNNDCTVNFENCIAFDFCGDGKLKDDEECDGTVFVNDMKTCSDFDRGFTSGDLKCTDKCEIDVTDCRADAKCGDGIVEGDEDCDGTKFYKNYTSCNTIFPDLYDSGKVKCTKKCKYDTHDCVSWCGNGSLNKKVGEVCDGDKFGGETCETLVGKGSTGTLKCRYNCTQIDTSGCSKPLNCGNGTLDVDEECDGELFPNAKTKCSDYDTSFSKGTVSCNANCTRNDSLCELGHCGNGVLDDGEVCDGTKFLGNKYACKTLFPDQYSSGQVTCSDNCEYDTSACVPLCGNGSVNTSKGEVCDHGETDKFTSSANTCEKVVGEGSTGTLICADDCQSIITVGCSEPAFCGDNIVNNNEQCDGTAFPGNKITCSAWDSKYNDGLVGCTYACQLDYSNCRENTNKEICNNQIDDDENGFVDCADPACASDSACHSSTQCGNRILDSGEECDGSVFLDNKTQCSEWMDVFKSGTVTCSFDCTVNYAACSTELAEICDNKIDDNQNGRIDCDDEACLHFEGCPGAGEQPDPPGNPGEQGSNQFSDSDCSSAPLIPTGFPWGFVLGMFGLGILMRRRD